MSKILIIFLFCAVHLNAQWMPMNNGLANKEVDAFAVNGNNIFAGTSSQLPSGVYLSADNGATWTPTPLNSHIISSLGTNGNNIFAGSFNNYGVYRSTNNGTSWTLTSSLNNQWVYAFAVNGSNIFAGAYGVWLSTNNGTNWTQTSLINQNVGSFAVNGNNIFAGANGVYLSTNNGTNWTQTSLNLVTSSLGANGSNIFAGTRDSGVYRSTNNGSNWIRTNLNTWVFSFAFNGNYIFAGSCCSGVYVSNDNGASWSQRNEGLGINTNINDLCILNNYIFAATGAKGMGIVFRRPLSELVGIQPVSTEIPSEFSLSQNYPNPFNPTTNFEFSIPLSPGVSEGRGVFVNLTIYDVMGREIESLVNEELKPGTYKADWSAVGGARDYPSGIYFYTLKTTGFTETKKMILIK